MNLQSLIKTFLLYINTKTYFKMIFFSKQKERNNDLEAYIIYTFTIDKTFGVSLYLSDYDMCYSLRFVRNV